MTSTRRGKAPLTPGARGATRNARLSRWSSRHRQPALLLGVLILSMLPLAKAPAPGPVLLQAVLDGQKLEETSGGVTRCVDRVPLGVLEKHDCSAAAPCWALVKAETPLAPLDGGTQLSSVSSIALLRTHSYSTGCAQSAPRSLRGVLNHDIVTALFAMDPMSYLFAYRTADSTVRYLPCPPTAQSQVGLRPLCAPRPPLAPPRHLLLTCARARAPTRARALTRALTRAPARILTLTPFQPPSLSATRPVEGLPDTAQRKGLPTARRCLRRGTGASSRCRLAPAPAPPGPTPPPSSATSSSADRCEQLH